MNELPYTYIRKLFLSGLIIYIITAWFSVGYHHPDEHFQVLEYCNYKLGNSAATSLPWEYAAQCRPALQPFVAFEICKFLLAVNLFNPFIVAFILRLISGIFSWWVTCKIVLLLLPEFKTRKGSVLFVCASFLLWYVPYFSVRFTAENIAGNFFFLALYLLLKINNAEERKNVWYYILSGFLLGLSLFLRLQMGFAFIGLAVWMFFIRKLKIKNVLLMATSGAIAIALCIVIDYWFYDVWVFSPLNYFSVNIIHNKAAEFGVYPFWYYVWLYIQIGIPPVSVALLIAFFAGVYKKPLHLFTLVTVLFLLGHSFIGHKEMRFLYPVSIAFTYLACIGVDGWLQRNTDNKYYRIFFPVFIFINGGMLLYRMFTPAQEAVKYFSSIYKQEEQHHIIVMSLEKSPYDVGGLDANFYKSKDITLQIVADTATLNNSIAQKSQPVLFLSKQISLPASLQHYRNEKIYCLFPDWLLKHNINKWEERSNIWALYTVYPSVK